MGMLIRKASLKDYESAERLMQQVHELHIGLRPDIHKAYQPVMSCEEFRSSCEEDTALIAETDNHIVGLDIALPKAIGEKDWGAKCQRL